MGFATPAPEPKKHSCMLRTISTSIFLIFCLSFGLVAQQEDKYNDLLILYVDGEYEKLIRKAEKYTEKSDTRRDAEPFLYLSKAYFEMSRLEEFRDEYPKAFRDALKYASKYRRKDKELEYWDLHKDFFVELRSEAMREADIYLEDRDPRGLSQAARIYKSLVDIDPDDAGAALMYGATLYTINRRGEADMLMKEWSPKLGSVSVDRMDDDQKEMFKFGLMFYADYLKDDGRSDSARATMAIGYPFFKDDNEFKIVYDQVQR